jgi:hypothetical protein
MRAGSHRVNKSLRYSGVAVVASLLVVACSTGAPTHSTDAPATGTSSPSTTTRTLGSATPGPVATLSPSPGRSVDTKTAQAQALLDQWDALIGRAQPDAIVFTGGLVNGGGWNGKNAGDDKIAFYAGWVHAAEPLATDLPTAGAITWPDGSSQSVPLISASDALDALIANSEEPQVCNKCHQLQVTGAHRTTVDAHTSRGDLNVPAWQFEFAPDDAPIDPITIVAVKDAVAIKDGELSGATHDGQLIETAYGSPDSKQLTVAFVGAQYGADKPCGADYDASAVESERAVAVIITQTPAPFPTSADGVPMACDAVGYYRTVTVDLASALGNRTILDVNYATPVNLKIGPPPTMAPAR